MQAYNPYLTPQQQASQAAALQQQIEYLQGQLQGVQSAMQQSYQQMQSVQQQSRTIPQNQSYSGVIVRYVDDFDKIEAKDVPMESNGAIFIKPDKSEIEIREWDKSGQIVPTTYRPVPKAETGGNNNVDISSPMPQKMEIGLSGDTTQAFMQRFDELANRLDVMERILNKPAPAKQTTSRSKKEAEP